VTHDPADDVAAGPGGLWNWRTTLRRTRSVVVMRPGDNLQYARGHESDHLIPIGELAARTGVAVTALRYYDELGLVRPKTRASGQRRYSESAVRAVGMVLFLREVGFSLAEVAELTGARNRTARWSALVDSKLSALAEQEHRLLVARTALEHARDCPATDPSRCPRLWSIVDARLNGESLEDSHAALHGTAPAARKGHAG